MKRILTILIVLGMVIWIGCTVEIGNYYSSDETGTNYVFIRSLTNSLTNLQSVSGLTNTNSGIISNGIFSNYQVVSTLSNISNAQTNNVTLFNQTNLICEYTNEFSISNWTVPGPTNYVFIRSLTNSLTNLQSVSGLTNTNSGVISNGIFSNFLQLSVISNISNAQTNGVTVCVLTNLFSTVSNILDVSNWTVLVQPYVLIDLVTNGSVLHYPQTNISGIAAINGPWQITNVSIQINYGAFTSALGTTHWTNTGELYNGTNTVTVVAYADNGSSSSPVTVKFLFDPTIANTNGDTYSPGTGWELAWSDEFNGDFLNTNIWTPEVRGDGCGNAELEYYTARSHNIWTCGGTLIIKAIKEGYGGQSYTSGRLNTSGKLSWRYGKMTARMKLPYGRCLWPAFWMMGQTNLGWPNNGEIDIMEYRGDRISNSSSALHGPSYSGSGCYTAKYTNTSGDLTNDFHVYEIVWTSSGITAFVDGTQFFQTLKSTVTGSGKTWVYDIPFYFLVNLAVGGTGTPFTGYQTPDTNVFPAYLFVDWVRIYTN